ncbi:MAG: protein kinase [Deltaproteobacteria bacterium]|nr:protein kinase [Deltaproteobacteria bacterium]
MLDFGIAKINTDPITGQGGDGLVTEEGRVLGTPGYMSPEQAAGKPLDHRTDVFALGVILYEMVTGKRPFEGTSSMDIIIATSRDEPRPAPELNPQVTPELDGALRQCLAKDPAQRWASCRELAAALQALGNRVSSQELAPTMMGAAGAGATEAMAATPDPAALAAYPGPAQASTTAGVGVTQRSEQSASKLPWIGGVVAVLAVAAAVVAFVFWPESDEPVADDPEVAEASELREPKVGFKALKGYHSPIDSRAEALDSPPMWATAAKDFEAAAEQAGAPQRWRAAHRFCEGQRQLLTGKHTEAEQRFRQSIKLDEQWAIPHVGLSMALAQQKKHAAALDEAQLAQRLDPELWIAVMAAARTYVLDQDFPAAIQEYRRALDMAPGTPTILAALALAYHARGLDEPAMKFANQALKADADMVSARILLAERALEARDGKLALSHATQAVSVAPDNASAWLAQGDAYLLLHRRDEARSALTTAVKRYDGNKQRGGPEARIDIVRAALKRGQLPPPRTFDRTSLGESESRSRTRAPPKGLKSPPKGKRTSTKPDNLSF